MTTTKKIPIDRLSGKVTLFARGRASDGNTNEIHWIDNYQFNDILTFKSFRRYGRSKLSAIWWSSTHLQEFTMLLEDMEKVVHLIDKGCLVGQFTFYKRGQDVNIKMVNI